MSADGGLQYWQELGQQEEERQFMAYGITQSELGKFFSYDGVTGNLIWKVSRSKNKAGMIAGKLRKDGYIQIRFKDKFYLAHRLIYMLIKGDLPRYLDHINRDKSDNRFENLRPATSTQNNYNKGAFKNNPHGTKGVIFHKRCRKWVAQTSDKGSCIYLGSFESQESAAKAYEKYAIEKHGEFFYKHSGA